MNLNLTGLVLAALAALSLSCAAPIRGVNADGTPQPLASEMEEGKHICFSMCVASGMQYKEYRPDGKCICQDL
jgi:hypothetical protein